MGHPFAFVESISDSILLAVNRWLSVRFNLLSSAIVGVTAVVAILTPSIDAALAGFILAFASTITNDVRVASLQVKIPRLIDALADSLFGQTVRQFGAVDGELVPPTVPWWPLMTAVWPQVALERVKEYSELKREPPEFIEPRPPAEWPSKGEIDCEGLVIRYAVSAVITDKRRLARLTLHTARPAERVAQPQLFHPSWRKGGRGRSLARMMFSQAAFAGRHSRPNGVWEEYACAVLLPLCRGHRRVHPRRRARHLADRSHRSQEQIDDHPS